MSADEARNTDADRPDTPPLDFGWTLVAECEVSAERALVRIREAWRIVASWGRLWDEPRDEIVGDDEAWAQLPDWLVCWPPFDDMESFRAWLLDVDERQWYWWSSAVIGPYIKIDLGMEGLPNSSGELWPVIAAAGARVCYDDLWINSRQTRSLATCERDERGMIPFTQVIGRETSPRG